MKNSFSIIGETVEIYIINKQGEKFVLLIDLKDLEKVKRYSWCVVKKRKRFYAICNTGCKTKTGYKNIGVHQYLLGYKTPLTCDHINMNGLDNCRSNLRICTNQENNRNKPLQNNNKSGMTGVYFSKNCQKWVVQINVNKKPKSFGVFLNKEDAILRRKELEREYHGEYAFKSKI